MTVPAVVFELPLVRFIPVPLITPDRVNVALDAASTVLSAVSTTGFESEVAMPVLEFVSLPPFRVICSVAIVRPPLSPNKSRVPPLLTVVPTPPNAVGDHILTHQSVI